MSAALARVARALTHHWKRAGIVALATLVVLGVLAGTGSPAADDFDAPGTESQEAIDLFLGTLQINLTLTAASWEFDAG